MTLNQPPLFRTDAPEVWKPLPNTNGKYEVSSWGTVINLKPLITAEEAFLFGVLDTKTELDINELDRSRIYYADGTNRTESIYQLMRDLFPEYYGVSQEEEANIKERIEKNTTIIYKLEQFNRIIFPNYLLQLYRKRKGKLPTKINPTANGLIILHKGEEYFGIGNKNIIHFKDYYPVNAKSWAEKPQVRYYKPKSKK